MKPNLSTRRTNRGNNMKNKTVHNIRQSSIKMDNPKPNLFTKSENLKIRKATKKDYKKIAGIYKLCFTKEEYGEVWTQNMTLKKIIILSKYCDIFVVVADNETIGFAAINPNKWYIGRFADIEEIGIHPKHQDKGYGKQLLKFIENYYKKKNYSYLIFTVNKTAKAYKKYKQMKYSEDKNGALFMRQLK